MLSVLSVGAWAQSSPYTGVAPGSIVSGKDYYLYNVESGLWLQNNDRKANDWSPRAQLGSRGLDFQLNAVEGGYKINAKFGRSSLSRDNYYLDNNDDHVWVFEAKGGSVSNAVTIKSDTRYLTADNYTAGKPYNNMYKVGEPNTAQWYLNIPENSTNGTWQIVTKEERLAKMIADGATQPVDATWLVKSPDFANNDTRYDSWIKTGTWDRSGDADGDWGRGSMVVQNYDTGDADICQTLEVPNGEYEFSFQGFYRDGHWDDIGTTFAEGKEEIRAKYYANHVDALFRSIIYPDHTTALTSPDRWPFKTGDYYVPNSMQDASRCINLENAYYNTPIRVKVTDGNLKIGFMKIGTKANDWVIIDNVKLTYLGPLNNDDSQDVTFTVLGGTNYGQKEGCDKAFDGRTDTKWGIWSGDQFVVLEASSPIYLTGYTFTTANDNVKENGRLPREWEIYGTNDASTATTLAAAGSFSNTGWNQIGRQRENSDMHVEDYTPQYFSVNSAMTSYKYIAFKNVISNCQLSEISFSYSREKQITYTAIDGCDSFGGEDIGKMFDRLAKTKLCTNASDVYVVFKSSEPIKVGGYTFISGGDAQERDPKAWKLYAKYSDANPGRNDTNWKLIHEVTNGLDAFKSDRRSYAHFELPSPSTDEYNCFKLEFTDVRDGAINTGKLTQFSEFYLTEGSDAYSRMTVFENADRFGNGTRIFNGDPNEYHYASNGSAMIFGNGHSNVLYGYSIQEWGGYNPTSWSLYGSENAGMPEAGDGSWELIHNIASNDNMATYKAHSYVFDVPTKEYNYFKLVVSGNGDENTTFVLSGFVPFFYRNDVNNKMILTEEHPVYSFGETTFKEISYSRSITNGNVVTFILPAEIPVSSINGSVWELSEYTGSALRFTQVTSGSLKANQPYLMRASGSSLIAGNVMRDATVYPIPSCDLKKSVSGAYQLGVYKSRNIDGISGTVYGYSGGNFVQATSGTLNPYRTLFVVESGGGVKEMSLILGDVETGIISINENGEIEDRNVDVYDLSGKKVRTSVAGSTCLQGLQKGIFIVNGKKYIIK